MGCVCIVDMVCGVRGGGVGVLWVAGWRLCLQYRVGYIFSLILNSLVGCLVGGNGGNCKRARPFYNAVGAEDWKGIVYCYQTGVCSFKSYYLAGCSTLYSRWFKL